MEKGIILYYICVEELQDVTRKLIKTKIQVKHLKSWNRLENFPIIDVHFISEVRKCE